MDKELAYVGVSVLADACHVRITAGRVLRRSQPKPGAQVACCLELARVANGSYECSGSQLPHARNRRQAPCAVGIIGLRIDFACELRDPIFKRGELLGEIDQQFAHAGRQGIALDAQNGRQGNLECSNLIAHGSAVLQAKGSHLVAEPCARAHQEIAAAMQCLQVNLVYPLLLLLPSLRL